MAIAIKFGSHDLGATEDVEQIQARSSHIVNPIYIPRKGGFLIPAGEVGPGEVSLSGKLASSSYTNLLTAQNTFNAALKQGKAKLTFDDTYYMYGQLRDFDWSYIAMQKAIAWTATFVTEEAKRFSETFQSQTKSPTTTVAYTDVANAGNATTRAKITITNSTGSAISNFTFENQTTGDKFKFTGSLANTKALIVNNYADYSDTAITVTNDGTDAIAYFEGDPIRLASGTNSLVYTGSTTVSVKTEWHDAYYL
jgi:hypothetical protein